MPAHSAPVSWLIASTSTTYNTASNSMVRPIRTVRPSVGSKPRLGHACSFSMVT